MACMHAIYRRTVVLLHLTTLISTAKLQDVKPGMDTSWPTKLPSYVKRKWSQGISAARRWRTW